MSLIWAALMPHPPILVPQVGRGREAEAVHTLAGLKLLEERLAELPRKGRPDGLVILSPHQPYAENALFLNTASCFQGHLGRFGAPQVAFDLASLPEAEVHFRTLLKTAGLPVVTSPVKNLTPDHGSLVPLYFLNRIFSSLPPVIAANPAGLSLRDALDLGRVLAELTAGPSPFSWAVLASGDLSHRLTRDAPAGYDSSGWLFDQAVVKALGEGRAENLMADWPPDRLAAAGECGLRSVLALLGLVRAPLELLSYEGPFGVGYAQAFWRAPAGAFCK